MDILSTDGHPETRYYAAFGIFISVYSLVEQMLKGVLQHEAGVTDEISKAIFSGVRTDQACKFIRRCYQARNAAFPSELNSLLSQLTVINGLRNDLVHLGTTFEDAQKVVTNRRQIISATGLREFVVAPEILDAATHDCLHILLGLAPFATDVFAKDVAAKIVADALQTPWRYKLNAPPDTDQTPPLP